MMCIHHTDLITYCLVIYVLFLTISYLVLHSQADFFFLYMYEWKNRVWYTIWLQHPQVYHGCSSLTAKMLIKYHRWLCVRQSMLQNNIHSRAVGVRTKRCCSAYQTLFPIQIKEEKYSLATRLQDYKTTPYYETNNYFMSFGILLAKLICY